MNHFSGLRRSLGFPLEDDDSAFCDLLDTVAADESDVVVIVKSFFDESYDDDLLCVAGYSFLSSEARALDICWRKMLTRYKRLPYFRMSACNAGQDPFDRLSEEECIEVATEAIGLIGKHAAHGFAVTVDQASFYRVVTAKGFVSTPYELCAWLCLVTTNSYAERAHPNSGMSFVFESGFKDQTTANGMMNNIFNAPKLRESYRYVSHSFIDKKLSRPTQAADILAWQWFKDYKRNKNGARKRRGDLEALISGTRHFAMHLGQDKLQEYVDKINEMAGSPYGSAMMGLALRNPKSPVFAQRPGETGSKEVFDRFVEELNKEG